MTNYRLGINLGFATNRYTEPEEWTRIVAEELGLGYVQMVADLLNPFWPKDYLNARLKLTKDCVKHYGLKVESIFTSTLTRTNHLTSPDEAGRQMYKQWFKDLFRIGAELGAVNGGAHFGSLTMKCDGDPRLRAEIIEDAVQSWRELCDYAATLGYTSLIFETMSIPRELACTIEEARELMARVSDGAAIPMKLCLDVGHAPHPDQRDPYLWLQELAADAPVIHLQQTQLNRSNHWPFTKQYNELGIIDPKKVVETCEAAGCTDALFAFEIGHREHWDTDGLVIQDTRESVECWRPYIKA